MIQLNEYLIIVYLLTKNKALNLHRYGDGIAKRN